MYLAQAIASDEFALKETPKYVNKAVAPTMEPIRSIGGFRTLPDYSFDTMPDDYAALVLIGGFGWGTPVADKVVPKTATSMRRPSATGISSRLTALQPSNLPGELLLLLENDTPERIEMYYRFNKQGFCDIFPSK